MSLFGVLWSHLRCYGSELVVAEQVELPAVRITAEVQSFIPVDGKTQNSQEKHPHRAEEQGVELADHRRRPELQHEGTEWRHGSDRLTAVRTKLLSATELRQRHRKAQQKAFQRKHLLLVWKHSSVRRLVTSLSQFENYFPVLTHPS